MISVQNLSKRYNDFYAVNKVSFQVQRGEIVGLLGHNGAGKTTIMKMLTGYLEPDQGTIQIDGKDIAEHRSEIQAKIGYLPENCPVYLEMTVIDYLEYAAGLKGLEGEDCINAIKNAIRRTDLTDKATQVINTLSRGYRQRVGVAQAILTTPDVLILDEPTNGLDPSQIQQMRELIADLGQNSTVIVSTHILHEVQAVCDRVLIIRDGQLALDSTLAEIKQGQRLFLTIDRKPDEAASRLKKMTGIQAVEFIEQVDGQYSYALNLDTTDSDKFIQTIPVLAKEVIEQGFALYALHPEIRDLETVFKEINTVDVSIEGGNSCAA
jgi:gliding motility-associated transport system ATP-binding protein